MKKYLDKIVLEDYLGCFGCFNIEDKVCKNLCAINMLCAVERQQKHQMELLDELISYETMFMTTQ